MYRSLTILLVLLFTLAVHARRSGRKNTKRADVQCALDGRRYAVGETWHPVVPPFGAMPCVNCTCSQEGEVNCKSDTCPKTDCPQPKVSPDQCCPRCEVAVEEEKMVPDNEHECEFHGTTHKHGAMFPSNKTALKPNREDQCVLCVCTNGRVLCHLKSCPASRCRDGYVNVTDDCCPRCKEDVFRPPKDVWLSHYSLPLNGGRNSNSTQIYTQYDCLGVDGIRKNGTTWKPEVAPFGLMKCVDCTCLSGKIECNRVKCPSASKLPCKRPRKVDGQCCKVCVKGKRRRPIRQSTPSTLPPTLPPSAIWPNNNHFPADSLHTPGSFHNLCMSKRTDRLVYRSNASHSFFLGFEIVKKEKVEILSWTIQRGRLSPMKREVMLSRDFRKQSQISQIIGATNKRHYKKFKRRLSKQLKRCEKRRSCRLRHVLKTFKRLRLRKVQFSRDCA